MPPGNSGTENLRRELGPASVALTSINVMVGSGIFVLPALVAEGLGATAILAYIACAVVVFFLAFCLAELGSKTNLSGGPYNYIEQAFGPYAGFLSSNLYVLGCLASDAALANALADTLQYFIPILRMDMNRFIFQLLVFGGLAWVNMSSVKNGLRFVVFTGLGKLIALILLVYIAIPHVETENLKWVVQPSINNIGSASLLLFFAFLGLESSLCNGGEIKNPTRSVPLGILGALSFVLLLYIGVQLVTQGTLGNSLNNHKDAPLAALANITIGKAGMVFIVAITCLSILGYLSGEILCVPRIMFAAARKKLLPSVLSKVHPRFATPHIAIAVYATIGFILTVSGGFKQLAIIASAAILLVYLGVALSVIKLRKQTEKQQGFRIPGGPVIPLLAAAGVLSLVFNSGKRELIGLSIFISLFSLIYLAIRKKLDHSL